MAKVIGDSLKVTGAVDLDTTLNVDGNAAISGQMNVTQTDANGLSLVEIGGTLLASVTIGSLTTAQTWTIDITLTTPNGRVSGIADIYIHASSSSDTLQRVYYRAIVGFHRVSIGNTATIQWTNELINAVVNATVTLSAIANGIRVVVAVTTGTANRGGAFITLAAGGNAGVITSVVA